jgi:hypothetical protein
MPLSGKEFIGEIQEMVRRKHSKECTQAFDESIG